MNTRAYRLLQPLLEARHAAREQKPVMAVRTYRLLRLFVAWVIGCAVMMVTHLVVLYDGLPSLVGALFNGIVASTGSALVIAAAGLALRWQPVGRWWRASWIPAALVLLTGVVLYLHGLVFAAYSTDDFASPLVAVRPTFFVGYALALFTLAHAPLAAVLGPPSPPNGQR